MHTEKLGFLTWLGNRRISSADEAACGVGRPDSGRKSRFFSLSQDSFGCWKQTINLGAKREGSDRLT